MSTLHAYRQLDDAAVAALRKSWTVGVFRPVDAGYEEHRRVWNGSNRPPPALIARCAGIPTTCEPRSGSAEGRSCPSRCAAAGTAFPASRCATTAGDRPASE